MKDWSPEIKAAIDRIRPTAKGQTRTIVCPICAGKFWLVFDHRGRARGICPPKAEGKPYCINWIE